MTRWCDDTQQYLRYYMRAEVPDWNIEDIRAMDLEDRVATKDDTPETFLARIQKVVPTVDQLVVPRPDGVGWAGHSEEGHSNLMFSSQAVWDSLPEFKWYQIFNMVGHRLEDKKAKGKK